MTALSGTSRRRGSGFRLVLLVLVSVAVVAADRADLPLLRELREGAGTVASPFEGAADWVTRPFRNAWHGVTDYDDVVAENAELREQLAERDAAEVEEHDSARRLEELSAMMDLPWAGGIEGVTARVVSGPRSNFSYALQMDKGTDDGIEVGMPVVSGGGLAGRVSHASSGSATVELLTGPDLQVGVRLASSGELGTLRGQGRDEPLVVDAALEPDAEVAEGEGLVTSGVERSVYPEAIPVARVQSTRQGPGGLSLELLAEPVVDVHRLSYVTVLIWTPPE